MRTSTRIVAALAAFTTLASSVLALPKVSRVGRYLYSEDGSRFYIKGISYQEQGVIEQSTENTFGEPSTFVDPLSLPDACARDVPFLKELGVNAIRVYSVDAALNHDSCMAALSAANIYTIIDLSLPVNGSIDRLAPSWSTNLLDLYIATIDAFAKYDNVLVYNIGNEVVIDIPGTTAATYIKAAARDTKAYLKSKKSSALVGYAAVDAPAEWRQPLASYLSCDLDGGNSDATSLDIYGLNNYEWCGDDSASAYNGLNGNFAGYNIPAYFSEFGCVKQPPRLWTETFAFFSAPMTDIWSGGLAFSYFPAASPDGEFGMVTVSSDGKTVTTSEDFARLKAAYAKVVTVNTPSQSAAGAGSFPSCPVANSTFLASNKLPPTPVAAACDCMEAKLSCTFTPKTADYTKIVGSLIDFTCNQLGSKNVAGLNCDAIGGNGGTGVYGSLSGCAPTQKLSYLMSLFYEDSNRQAEACSFSGNGTAHPDRTVAAAPVASSCLSNASGTSVPVAPSDAPVPNANGNGNSANPRPSVSGGANNGSGASPSFSAGLAGLTAAVGLTVFSAVWTLV